MSAGNTTRTRQAVVGATPDEAVAVFGVELDDALATSFADFAADVDPESCASVRLVWGEGALPVLQTVVGWMVDRPDLRVTVVDPADAHTPAYADDWVAESLRLRVAELEQTVADAQTERQQTLDVLAETREQLETARQRNKALKDAAATPGLADRIRGVAGRRRDRRS